MPDWVKAMAEAGRRRAEDDDWSRRQREGVERRADGHSFARREFATQPGDITSVQYRPPITREEASRAQQRYVPPSHRDPYVRVPLHGPPLLRPDYHTQLDVAHIIDLPSTLSAAEVQRVREQMEAVLAQRAQQTIDTIVRRSAPAPAVEPDPEPPPLPGSQRRRIRIPEEP